VTPWAVSTRPELGDACLKTRRAAYAARSLERARQRVVDDLGEAAIRKLIVKVIGIVALHGVGGDFFGSKMLLQQSVDEFDVRHYNLVQISACKARARDYYRVACVCTQLLGHLYRFIIAFERSPIV
jgi:hypothetical protein